MALFKRILLFLISLVCIIVFFSVTTSSYAENIFSKDGIGAGTRSCNNFLASTSQVSDNELTKEQLFRRVEFIQWAYGFLTALNIQYEATSKNIKDLSKYKDTEVFYNNLLSGCNFIKEKYDYDDFAIAISLTFTTLEDS